MSIELLRLKLLLSRREQRAHHAGLDVKLINQLIMAIEDLDEPSVHNDMADHLADEYYSPDQPSVDNNDLTGYLEGYFYHQNHPVTVPFRNWAQQQVRLVRSRHHYTISHPLALSDIEIDWDCLKSVAKQHKYLWQRTQSMKVI